MSTKLTAKPRSSPVFRSRGTARERAPGEPPEPGPALLSNRTRPLEPHRWINKAITPSTVLKSSMMPITMATHFT